MNGSNRKERVSNATKLKPSTANGAVQGESWAIREAPLLIAQTVPVYSPNAGCAPDDHPNDDVLPVAILH